MTSWPYSRSCRTASIRSGIAGGLAGELRSAVWTGVTRDTRPTPDSRPEKMMQRSSRNDVEYWDEA